MAKTAKYEMCVNTYNMIGSIIPLSQKTFTRTLDNYTKQIHENIEERKAYCKDYSEDSYKDGTNLDDIKIKTTEHERYIETLYVIHDGNAVIYFRKREAKKGYCWK